MKVQIINNSNNPLPKYETEKSAGLDIRANLSRLSPVNLLKAFGDVEVIYAGESHPKTMVKIGPGSRALIPTGIFTAIPEGYEIQLRPRSGLSIKKALTLVNCIGTIDADYRNEWGMPVINLGYEDVWIEDGERICQAVLNKVEHIDWEVVKSLNETERVGGFGSTGSM